MSMHVTKPSRLLLVGSTGRVGRMITRCWQLNPPSGAKVTEQHRNSDRSEGLFWPLLSTDAKGLPKDTYDAIICLAGVTPGLGADLALNTTLAEATLRSAKLANIPRVLIASSSAVYGSGDGTPFCETSTTTPANSYGAAKLDMENACATWRNQGIEICCLRIGNVAGADALLLNVARSEHNQPLVIDRFADGRGPVRSYIGPRTLSDVLLTLATTPLALPNILNVAAPGSVTMEELARAAGHPFDFKNAHQTAQQTITLDCSRLAELHDFSTDAAEPMELVTQWKDTLPK